jgi:ferredoxin-NADP reductase
VISVHLADPEGGSVPAALPGQFLTLRLHPDPAGTPLLRSYSLSGPVGARDYRISVKREEHGAASQFLHARVRAGDLLEAAAPRGTFTLRPGQAPVLLISAGVGATPVLAMLHALAAARSTRDIWWLHGARRRADEPFAAESRALLAALPARTGTSATAARALRTAKAATTKRRGACRRRSLPPWTCPVTPMPTCAAPLPSWPMYPLPWPRPVSRPPASAPRSSAPGPR